MTAGRSLGARLALACLVAAAACLPAAAQDLSDDWEVIGTVEAMIDDAPMTFFAARRIDTGEATVIETPGTDGRIITIGAMTPDQAGEPGLPILTLKLHADRAGFPAMLEIDLREAERVLMANDHSETDALLEDLRIDADGGLSFAFQAELMVMAPNADGSFAPLPGAVGDLISGRFDGRLPAQ
ncbi:hypothetical protein ACRDNQ_03525 [Palleronia sp. KMU-117]|uniref:hypothetical protein n=1 Tax=Palleronia sp. KMU-117 TaxID=3434108 RepID=UPI003D7228C7